MDATGHAFPAANNKVEHQSEEPTGSFVCTKNNHASIAFGA